MSGGHTYRSHLLQRLPGRPTPRQPLREADVQRDQTGGHLILRLRRRHRIIGILVWEAGSDVHGRVAVVPMGGWQGFVP